jgi:hypothetical protein
MASLKTAFWRQAAQSLPEGTRRRYLADFEGAEHFELVLDGLIELVQRAKHALHMLGGAHSA